MGRIRILIVDDQRSIRCGLRMRLEIEADIEVVGEAEDGAAGVRLATLLAPDVVLMDIEMPVLDGVSAARCIAGCSPTSAVIMLSLHDGIDVRERARAAGAAAFVAKHQIDDALLDAIRGAARQRHAGAPNA